jgi:drug/metabolite transporter (DMT)-like permease
VSALQSALLSVAASAIGQLLLRRGASVAAGLDLSSPSTWLTLLLNPYVIGGVCAWAVATLLWLATLARSELSAVYLLTSLNYLIVPLAAAWLFRERLPPLQLLAMALISGGVLLALYARTTP